MGLQDYGQPADRLSSPSLSAWAGDVAAELAAAQAQIAALQQAVNDLQSNTGPAGDNVLDAVKIINGDIDPSWQTVPWASYDNVNEVTLLTAGIYKIIANATFSMSAEQTAYASWSVYDRSWSWGAVQHGPARFGIRHTFPPGTSGGSTGTGLAVFAANTDCMIDRYFDLRTQTVIEWVFRLGDYATPAAAAGGPPVPTTGSARVVPGSNGPTVNRSELPPDHPAYRPAPPPLPPLDADLLGP